MSLNDPQWGKRGGSGGPPDLDEIWRNVNRRMNELFGRKPGSEETPPEGGGDLFHEELGFTRCHWRFPGRVFTSPWRGEVGREASGWG